MAKSLGWYRPEQLILKVTLGGSDPAIWRRVEVHSGLSLHELHYVIQNVFEWQDDHLYHYIVTPQGKLTRKAMREAVYFQGPSFDPLFDDEEGSRKAEEMMVGRVITDDCRQIIYEYDMGDSWEHLVKLEKRTPGGEQNHVPVCLAGENAAPREDMGGIWGFYEYVAALKDKSHEMHEMAVDWLGKDFDPAKFDLAEVNSRLAKCFKPTPKRPRKKRNE